MVKYDNKKVHEFFKSLNGKKLIIKVVADGLSVSQTINNFGLCFAGDNINIKESTCLDDVNTEDILKPFSRIAFEIDKIECIVKDKGVIGIKMKNNIEIFVGTNI